MMSDPRDIRQDDKSRGCEDGQGMNTLAHAAAALASSSSTCESYLEHDVEERKRDSSRTGESSSPSGSPGASGTPFKQRPPRPTYTQEQEDAIRFHRDDLGMTWEQVCRAYNDLYDKQTGIQWESRTISGLQSRYYRLLPEAVNSTRKMPRPELGILVKAPERRYWWMEGSRPISEATTDSLKHMEDAPNDGGDYSEGGEYGADEEEDEEEDARSQDAEQKNPEARQRKRKQAPLSDTTRYLKRMKKQKEESNDPGADRMGNIIIQVTPAITKPYEEEPGMQDGIANVISVRPQRSGGLQVIDHSRNKRAKKSRHKNMGLQPRQDYKQQNQNRA